MNFHISIRLLVCTVLLFGCARKTETTTETEHHEEVTNTVSLTGEQMRTAGIVLGSIEMKNLISSIKVNGMLEVPSENKAFVTSLVGGVLRSIKVHPGSYVRKGQVIGTIANTEVSGIQQELATINAQLRYAEQEQERQRVLVHGNAAPLKNLQRAESEVRSLRAQRVALQKQLSILGVPTGTISSTITITAPISGAISEVKAQIGSNIDQNAPIAEIINNSELHLDLFVYERDLPKVKPGNTIHFTLTNNPGKEYDATIYSIGTAFANESKAVPIHAKVVNDKTGLIEGMSVTALISLGENVYPAVPDEAIVNNDGKDYIFVLADAQDEHEHMDTIAHKPELATAKKHDEHEDEHEHGHELEEAEGTLFKRVQVIKGVSDVGYTEIKFVEPLRPGAKAVVKGAFFLMAKMTNAGEAHEH